MHRIHCERLKPYQPVMGSSRIARNKAIILRTDVKDVHQMIAVIWTILTMSSTIYQRMTTTFLYPTTTTSAPFDSSFPLVPTKDAALGSSLHM